jgi:hypothetical protein
VSTLIPAAPAFKILECQGSGRFSGNRKPVNSQDEVQSGIARLRNAQVVLGEKLELGRLRILERDLHLGLFRILFSLLFAENS